MAYNGFGKGKATAQNVEIYCFDTARPEKQTRPAGRCARVPESVSMLCADAPALQASRPIDNLKPLLRNANVRDVPFSGGFGSVEMSPE